MPQPRLFQPFSDSMVADCVAFLKGLPPRQKHVYHEGLNAQGPWCAAARVAADDGFGFLTQKAVQPPQGPRYYQYIFTRSSRK
ncbi:hypothetical protein [Ferrovibrio sp.]|uniref:hypothetical protein n=1 Tax=Ferrovibrio sp. TaxID=1917215 RepID=UPI00311EC330